MRSGKLITGFMLEKRSGALFESGKTAVLAPESPGGQSALTNNKMSGYSSTNE
jgi:hypothetical protein